MRKGSTPLPLVSDWPAPALRVWFFLSLARRFDPFVLRDAWCPEDQEVFARLRYLFALRRRKALECACAALGEHLPPSLAAVLETQFAAARDLFEELEIQRELGIFDRAIEDYVRPELADARDRERLLHQLAFGFEAALHDLEHGTARPCCCFRNCRWSPAPGWSMSRRGPAVSWRWRGGGG